MNNYIKYFISIILIFICTCTQQENRKMWEPSYAYIGVEPNDDASVRSGADAVKNFAQDKNFFTDCVIETFWLTSL